MFQEDLYILGSLQAKNISQIEPIYFQGQM